MNTNKTILLIAAACIIVAAGIYKIAYMRQDIASEQNATPTPSMGKVAASDISDGTYTTQIHSIRTSGEDTTITFKHVTYFSGAEASSSAAHDEKCGDTPILACIPTLTKGYYVRASGAADFSAPINVNTTFTIHGISKASVRVLQEIQRQFDPVFNVVLKDGNIASITEKSPK